jgi:hypothetical protein
LSAEFEVLPEQRAELARLHDSALGHLIEITKLMVQASPEASPNLVAAVLEGEPAMEFTVSLSVSPAAYVCTRLPQFDSCYCYEDPPGICRPCVED